MVKNIAMLFIQTEAEFLEGFASLIVIRIQRVS